MSEKTMWTMIVLAALALVGVFAWRRGLLARIFPPSVPGAHVGYPQPFVGGTGPQEIAQPGGGSSGSTYGKVCTTAFRTGGQIAVVVGDPSTKAAGAVAVVGAPAICAAQEWVAKGAVSAAKTGAQAVGTAASKVGSTVKGWFS